MPGTASRPSGSTGQPRTRQRRHKSPPVLDVPDIEKDAAERKRVLNVLAQRRYREKKRLNKKSGSHHGATAQSSESQDVPKVASAQASEPTSLDSTQHLSTTPPSIDQGVGQLGLDFDLLHDPIGVSEAELGLSPEDLLGLLGNEKDADQSLPVRGALPSSLPEALPFATNLDTAFAAQFPSFGALDQPTTLSASTVSSSSTLSFTPSPAGEFDFPDSYMLPVHELTLLRGLMRVSTRIGCDTSEIWSPTCLSPFNTNTGTPAALLPPNWRPTSAQITVPHHPLLDLLPWPSVRDRIIMILNLPDEARPTHARGAMALFNFAYDFEDSAEGARIYGDDPCDGNSWEVGQVLFERWWFLFDRTIVEGSNRWRALRGAPPLMVKDVTES
ncbi:uncharacterized protein F5Z01DRAFT_383704 [Emericellopsis atlantica]|uniref:BZIP domain-containing protein n=1 Tax=Emericellopsis atlantica TaxID=2614577 RepID=A0A9P7ZT67_9HYPO|nr:uncharacterized protein F5Z01DRAFT_383704 [Emericellopsis atlantica]KAG9257362.1 hypothetical protein F5Z01DRAFT_383704 [Emericellopsis atlantica]